MSLWNRVAIVRKAFKGLRVIKKLMRKNKNSCLFLSNLNGIGDICIEIAYLNEYITQIDNSAKFVVCVDRESLVEQFGIPKVNVKTVTSTEIECMEVAMAVAYFKHWTDRWVRKGRIIAANPGYYVNSRLSRLPNLSALEIMKYGVYGVSQRAKPRFPQIHSKLEVDSLDKPYIIINPFSNSNTIPIEIFRDLSRKLHDKGYNVYVNLTCGQKEIEGTIPLNVTIQELYALSRNAECIISTRSGILDYIVSNAKRIICLYNDDNAWVTPSFYSLEKWETDCEIFNHIYPGSIDVDEIVKEAVSDAD